MTSVIVPPVDLAPGMPSRIVTISATDVTEGGKSLAGQMVRFALSDTLDVTSGGDVIAKTQAEVVLDADGNGSIRLPVYDENVKTWCGDPDWAILVTATWGSQKAIRVPAGTTSIALSALPPVRPLRGREKQWAVTGASLTITEGTDWAGTASLVGGILGIKLTVPAAGSGGDWWRGLRSGEIDNYVNPGYQSSLLGGIVGTPTTSGFLAVRTFDTGSSVTISQRWEEYPSGKEWVRSKGSGSWGLWTQVNPSWWRGLRSGQIDDYITPSEQSAKLSGLVGSPSVSGFLTVRILGADASEYVVQTWEEWPSGKEWTRSRVPDGTWLTWSPKVPDAKVNGTDEHLVRLSELRRRRGPVEVTTPGVVVLALDHGLTNFKAKILPLLQARGLTTTLAINSQNWADAQNSGATQSEVKAWEAAGTVEVANHGRTHSYPTSDPAWETEIRGGREELEAQLGVPIDTYQMAGSDWGATISDLGRSGRGGIALSSHAIVTGMLNDGAARVYPLDGEPTIGTFGYWIDQGGALIDTAKARIQDAITERGTVIIRHHPQFMDETGYITAAAFAAFLDHLVTLRDSGQITVLQQRDAMIAAHAEPDWAAAIAALNSAAA